MMNHIDGHTWRAIAVFARDAVNDGLEQRPLLWVKCAECPDTRIISGEYFVKG